MKKNILILGGTGMLGSMLVDVFAKSGIYTVSTTVRDNKSVNNLRKIYPNVNVKIFNAEIDKIKDIIKEHDYPWIINAIGVIKPYISDNNAEKIERAIRINALFPHKLVKKATKSKILQIATDCVFSGEKSSYDEFDQHDPLDVYGKTKSLGEVYEKNVYHLRCSIIGPEIKNKVSLLEWFLSQPKNTQINGYTNHSWNGITTYHFAKICMSIIKNNIDLPHIQHIVPKNNVSKAELLEYFRDEFDRPDIVIKKMKAQVAVRRTLNTNNKLLNKRLWNTAGHNNIPTVKRMIEELAIYLKNNL